MTKVWRGPLDVGRTPKAPSVRDVAEWMLARVKDDGLLPRHLAAHEIRRDFGEDLVYLSKNHLAITPDVVREFRKLSGDDVVWERGEGRWALRQTFHKPGRDQQ